MARVGRLGTRGPWFVSDDGRTVLLRGVNLGGDCKVPTTPDERTDRPTDFAQHATASFIGRPFPLSEAPAHLGRLRHWGCTSRAPRSAQHGHREEPLTGAPWDGNGAATATPLPSPPPPHGPHVGAGHGRLPRTPTTTGSTASAS